jgi:hypothetical protein
MLFLFVLTACPAKILFPRWVASESYSAKLLELSKAMANDWPAAYFKLGCEHS